MSGNQEPTNVYTTAIRKDALGRSFMREERKRDVPFFLPSKDFFTPITKRSIQPGDWLAEHPPKGKGQMYRMYNRYNPVMRSRNIIYIVPMEDIVVNPYFKMADLAEYIEAFFGGKVKVKVMNTKLIKGFKKSVSNIRTRDNYYGKQYFTPEVFKFMKTLVPSDSYASIAITSVDLFNKDSWNYVYGIASLKSRIGVFSYRRYIEETDDVFKKLARLSVHEIGHQFGLKHCIYYQCVMNGFNGPNESFKRPPRLCPVCMRKLKKNCKFDIRNRYGMLMKVYEKHGHVNQLEWVKKRLEYVDELVKKNPSLMDYTKMFRKMK